MTSELFKLRDDKYTFLFDSPNTNKDFLPSSPKDFKTEVKFFVFIVSKVKSSTTVIALSLALILSADFRANLFKFLFNLKE